LLNIVAYLLHVRTVEPPKQPLLSNTRTQQENNGVMQSVSKQRLSKHGKHSSTIEKKFSMWSVPRPLLCNVAVNTPQQSRDCVFSSWCVPRRYLEDNSRYEAVGDSVVRVNQRAMEAEEYPLLRFITRKRVVKILQNNSHS
jgi:hypothetical protein